MKYSNQLFQVMAFSHNSEFIDIYFFYKMKIGNNYIFDLFSKLILRKLSSLQDFIEVWEIFNSTDLEFKLGIDI